MATVGGAILNPGFGVQARYVLPFVAIVPLAAGEILSAGRHRLPEIPRRCLPLVFAVPVASVHLLAWYSNVRRYEVRVPGPRAFVGRAEWSPPLGWVPWLRVVALAAVTLVMGRGPLGAGPGRPGDRNRIFDERARALGLFIAHRDLGPPASARRLRRAEIGHRWRDVR